MLPKDPKQVEEYRENLSKSLTGRKLSDMHKKRLSEARLKVLIERQRRYRNGKHRKEYLKKTRNYNHQYNRMNREEKKIYNQRQWIKKIEMFEKIAGRKRPERCEICGSKRTIVFDHDHETGKFRGWICDRCNKILGLAKDDINLLNFLISYLKNSSQFLKILLNKL